MCFGWRQCFPGASGLQSKERLQLAFLFFFLKNREKGGGERRHMWRIRPHLSSSTLSARPLLPEPSLLPVSWWTGPRGHTHARKLFFLYLQHTTRTHLTVSLHLCPTLSPLPLCTGIANIEHTISLSVRSLSSRAPVGFKLLGRCGGAHIPGYCRREYSWLWQKLYTCDILTVKFAG